MKLGGCQQNFKVTLLERPPEKSCSTSTFSREISLQIFSPTFLKRFPCKLSKPSKSSKLSKISRQQASQANQACQAHQASQAKQASLQARQANRIQTASQQVKQPTNLQTYQAKQESQYFSSQGTCFVNRQRRDGGGTLKATFIIF